MIEIKKTNIILLINQIKNEEFIRIFFVENFKNENIRNIIYDNKKKEIENIKIIRPIINKAIEYYLFFYDALKFITEVLSYLKYINFDEMKEFIIEVYIKNEDNLFRNFLLFVFDHLDVNPIQENYLEFTAKIPKIKEVLERRGIDYSNVKVKSLPPMKDVLNPKDKDFLKNLSYIWMFRKEKYVFSVLKDDVT